MDSGSLGVRLLSKQKVPRRSTTLRDSKRPYRFFFWITLYFSTPSVLKEREREGEIFLIYTGPEGKLGGESRFPLSFKTDGVCNTKLFFILFYFFIEKIIFFFKGPLGAF